MSEELGLIFDPAKFSYAGLSRPEPEEGKLYDAPDVQFLRDVPYRPLAWLWHDRIPWNKLTVIEGPPESGKSLLTIDLAARASRGEALPGDPAANSRPLCVYLVSGNDDLHDTVLPRINRAGGDISNFAHLSRIARSIGDDDPIAWRRLALPLDGQRLEESIAHVAAEVMIVDPLSAFCRSAGYAEATLHLLEDLASRIGIPIIATLTARTYRDESGRWQSKPMLPDSPARCVWSIVADPDEAERWLFVPTRMTFAAPGPGLAYRIVGGKIAWEPLPELTIPELDEPVAWLESILQQGEVRGADVNRQAGELGITKKMLRRARKVLNVAIRRDGSGEKATSYWSLPGPGHE